MQSCSDLLRSRRLFPFNSQATNRNHNSFPSQAYGTLHRPARTAVNRIAAAVQEAPTVLDEAGTKEQPGTIVNVDLGER